MERTADGAERFRALVEQVPVVTYTEDLGDAGVYTYFSPQIEKLLGYTPHELIDRPRAYDSRIHSDDRAAVQRESERTSATGEPFRVEYRVQTRDGRWLHVRDEATLVRDNDGLPVHRQGVIVDVTEQREAEAALADAEHRYRELFDDAPVMYVTTKNDGGNGIIEDCNALFLSTLGFERDEVIGRSLAEFLPHDSRSASEGGAQDASPAETLAPVEIALLARDGRIVDVLLSTRPVLNVDGSLYGMRAGFINISARKATEAALRESEERFRAAFDTPQSGWQSSCLTAASGK